MTLVAYYVEFFMRNTMKKKTHQNWTKNKKNLHWKLKNPLLDPPYKHSRLDHPKSIIFGIIMLKFKMDPNYRTKVIEWKPNCLRMPTWQQHNTTPKFLRLYKKCKILSQCTRKSFSAMSTVFQSYFVRTN